MLPVNSGKWAVLHAGLELVEEDAVLILDADGSAGIDQLVRDLILLERVLKERAVLFGTRFHKDSVVNGKGPIRSLLSRGYRVYVRLLYWFASGKSDVDDMQCPFKLVHRSRIISWYGGERTLLTERFSGDMELACCIDSKIYNLPIEFNHEKGGSVRFKTIFEMAWDTFQIAMRFRRLSKNKGKKTYLLNVGI
jgi:glycosyltransferase involved in cell wall biosynthesis